jgi:hypothetical protein
MNIERRDFLKICGAASVLLLPGIASAAKHENANNAPTSSGADSHIEKSIRANFGGGFTVRAHTQSDGLTYANIEHVGNRYVVTSADLLDWTIVLSDVSL